MDLHGILEIVGNCLIAVGVAIGGHHTFKSWKNERKNKPKISKKDKKLLKIKQKLEKLNATNN